MAGAECVALCCDDRRCAFRPMRLERRPVGRQDVLVDIKYCGVCASDLWTARSGQSMGGMVEYPFVGGHEIAGVCLEVGEDVVGFKRGDRVGAGCLADSCRRCAACDARDEARCKRQVGTYACRDTFGRVGGSTAQTAGGYARRIVVDARFAIKIPVTCPLEKAAPILCAGTSAYERRR